MKIPIIGPLLRRLAGSSAGGRPRAGGAADGDAGGTAGAGSSHGAAPEDDESDAGRGRQAGPAELPTVDLPSGEWDYAVFPASGGRSALQLRDPSDRRNRMVAWIDGRRRDLADQELRRYGVEPYRRCWVGSDGLTWCIELDPDGHARAFIDRGTSDTEASAGLTWTPPGQAGTGETEQNGLPWRGLGTVSHADLDAWFQRERQRRATG